MNKEKKLNEGEIAFVESPFKHTMFFKYLNENENN